MAGTIARQEIERQVRDSRERGVPRPSFSAILRDAGNRTRKAFQGWSERTVKDPENQPQANPGARPAVAVTQTKTEAKRNIPQPPTARMVPSSSPEGAPSDPESVIAAARRKSMEDIIGTRQRRLGNI